MKIKGIRLDESTLRMFCGSLLWLVSWIMTAGLFLTLAGQDILRQGVLLAMAFGLEGAKILSWRMGGRYRLLAVSLISISILASFGAALQTVSEYSSILALHSEIEKRQTYQYQSREQELAQVDSRISALIRRIDLLPPEFTTALKQINLELSLLQDKRTKLRLSLESASEFNTSQHTSKPGSPDESSLGSASEKNYATMFDLIADAIGQPVDRVILVILMVLAVNLEVAALVLYQGKATDRMVGDDQPKIGFVGVGQAPIPVHREKIVLPSEFLEAMKDGAELPLLHGRDTTAQVLGISSAQAKRLVKELMRTNRIEAKGKRLVLVGE